MPADHHAREARGKADELLRVAPSGRYFETAKGKPWFWLGDTCWPMFTAYAPDEVARYLASRARMGFSLVQVSPLWDGGTTSENGENPNPNQEGVQPWANQDPLQPNEAFWKNVDAGVRVAREHGLYLGLLPAWGSYVVNTRMITLKNARAYGCWLGERYRNAPNIVWVNGGDRKLVDETEAWRALSHGLAEGDGGAHPILFHPGCEEHATSHGFHHEDWLAAGMIQTWKDYVNIPGFVAEGYQLKPTKPVILAEGAYEDGPEYETGPITPLVVRKQAWWSYLSGGFHTYGHCDMWRKNPTWEKSLASEGARNMGVLRDIFATLDWWNLVPAQEMFASGEEAGTTFNAAARSRNGDWALVYLSSATTVELRCENFRSENLVATWINPATGGRTDAGKLARTRTDSFTTPLGWEDAVLELAAG
jgi:hypothetical protein